MMLSLMTNLLGSVVKGMTGSNATKSNFMTMAAGRKWLDNGGYVGVVYGYSQREVSQDYRIGGGERLSSLGQDILAKEKEAYFHNAGYVLNSSGQWTPDLNKIIGLAMHPIQHLMEIQTQLQQPMS